jgi:hypothetical protein
MNAFETVTLGAGGAAAGGFEEGAAAAGYGRGSVYAARAIGSAPSLVCGLNSSCAGGGS